MNIFNHTTTWIKGELFEASLIVSVALATIVCGLLFWKIGTTPNSKALLWPLVVTGIIYSAVGISMLISNQKRLSDYEKSYSKNPVEFTKSEKKRVEDFQYTYKISKVVASICFPITLLLFWFSKSPGWHGAGIGLAWFALMGLVIDHFSQERAGVYYESILKALEQTQ